MVPNSALWHWWDLHVHFKKFAEFLLIFNNILYSNWNFLTRINVDRLKCWFNKILCGKADLELNLLDYKNPALTVVKWFGIANFDLGCWNEGKSIFKNLNLFFIYKLLNWGRQYMEDLFVYYVLWKTTFESLRGKFYFCWCGPSSCISE